MADKNDQQGGEEKDEPKIRIVDRRMLSDEERAGKGSGEESEAAAETDAGARPKLEVIGGGTPKPAAAPRVTLNTEEVEDVAEADEAEAEEEPLSEAEQEQMRAEMEQEQFAAIEQQMGRPLTEQEKDQVRAEMERQAGAMANLEIPPMLQQLMAEMSARAAIHMGLMPNPYTRLVTRNDVQARLAIDAFAAVLDVVKPHLDPASQQEYARVLNDLRVNFVSITGGSPSGPSRIIH